ncbi:MAG: GAF domain-containing protein [Chloroflexi bacterium]|nr:GAF domain-containing protein [Chloroflexota bacterium]
MDISNVQIIEDEEASKRLQALYEVSHILTQVEADGRDLSALLPRVFMIVVRQLEAADGSIILVNEHFQVEHIWPAGDNPIENNSDLFYKNILEEGLAGLVVRHGEPVIIDDSCTDPRWLPRSKDHATVRDSWSIMCTPFKIGERTIGAATIRKPGKRQFNQRDLALLTAVSNQATNAIENARLLEESRRQLRISSLLNDASRTINSTLNINEVMQLMLAQMNDLLHAEAISIALVDKQSNELVYQVAEGIGSESIVGLRLPSNHGLSGWVMETSTPAHVPDTSADLRFKPMGDERTGYQTRAMICAPMTYKGDVLGTIQAINPNNSVFTNDDLNLLVNLANIASSAIANAQQFTLTQVAESRYTGLFQDSIDPIILADFSGKIIEANRRAFAFMGYSRQELLQMTIKDLHIPEASLPNVRRMQPHSVRVFNSQIVAKNGRRIHVEIYTKRTPYGDSELIQWIHHDISKQIELEEMRKDLQAMLFHDLQSPLGNVISSLELLTYELPEDSNPILMEMVDIAMRSSSRLQTLIRSLLDINSLEAGHPITEQSRVTLTKLVEDVWDTVKPSYERREIELIRNIPAALPDIYAQEDMIRRVLINLLDNAIKYSPDSLQITFDARQNDADYILISISDQGEGIPEALRDTIFEKFRRIKTDTYSKGLGLGLAFCRLAVEAHGGKIWVDDAPGGGARFNFTLPIWMESRRRNES